MRKIDQPAHLLQPGSMYRNQGNLDVLALVPAAACRILDVGCGAGDNARLLTASGRIVTGVTCSEAEARFAASHLEHVLVADIEAGSLPLPPCSFDALILSHVIEHVRNPAAVLTALSPLLKPEGILIIAVPNMANWRLRVRFAIGNWSREDTGPLDRTHLHFWSFLTAPSILNDTPFHLLERCAGQVSMPLWPLRFIAPQLCSWLDSRFGPLIPNLFAGQVLLTAAKTTNSPALSSQYFNPCPS
jgi:SAM-dependent methyltransferase